MKVFLVFLALVIVFTGALAFASDSLRFVLLQKRLKVLAEECAEAAALCIDEEESQRAHLEPDSFRKRPSSPEVRLDEKKEAAESAANVRLIVSD